MQIQIPQHSCDKSLKTLRRCVLALALAGGLVSGACNGDNDVALLSSLFNQRMTVILKATYASDRPLTRAQINSNVIFTDADDTMTGLKHQALTGCTPYTDAQCVPSYSELPIWLDIGELRLSSRSPLSDLSEIQSSEDAQKFWDPVSVERQVYCSIPYAIDFDNACVQTGGIVNFSELTNGNGAVYPASDVPSGMFLHSGIYVRALAFGYGYINGQVLQDKFDNRDILGYRVTPLLQYDPNEDELNNQLKAPQWFPLHHKVVFGQEQTIVLDHGESPAILEYRFNLIENLMLHSFYNSAQSANQVVIGLSDWRRGHDDNSTDQGFHMGGNALARSRIFYPWLTSDLYIDGGVESTRHYYALYVQNEEPKNEYLPYAATPVRNGSDNVLKYIMPSPYVIQCRYDCNNDGYPELVLSTSDGFQVGQGPGSAVISHPCGCGIDSATVSTSSCVAQTGCY
ncbi:MAG: hypothetical protein KDK39_04595 [Leptospiraceae bacterium]|nr:hypothetical protein [Leptospiraceae bacterium]